MRRGVRGCEDNSCVCSPWLTQLPACHFKLKLPEIHFDSFIIYYSKSRRYLVEKEPTVVWDLGGLEQEFLNNILKSSY